MADTLASENSISQPLFAGEKSLSETDIYVSLTYSELDAKSIMARVKSGKAGAVVLFAGTQLSIALEMATADEGSSG